MTTAQRIMRCRLIEEAERDPEYAKQLGLLDQTQTQYKDITGSSHIRKGGGRNNEES
ncbi:MAG: hypothetical protein IKF54_01765 [Eubacterium sp.]|nr:hypothetical protein [Eubacterium sp.]